MAETITLEPKTETEHIIISKNRIHDLKLKEKINFMKKPTSPEVGFFNKIGP